MLPVEIKPGIFWVGVNDRTTELFEGLWPIKREGVVYNSYLINDEKKALIDMSKEMTAVDLMEMINQLLDPSELDYVVINHMEPDHSGALAAIRRLAPNAILLGTQKTSGMLESFYGIHNHVQVVNDGEEISLGKHTLKFFATPFIHWPETMMTYETTENILFSCDAFGGYGALNGTIFDEPILDLGWYEEQSLRYYVNIVSQFSRPVMNAIKKLQNVSIKVVAPSHGLVWRNRPDRIIQLYQKWAGYAAGPCEPGVTLLFASMYGNTERMMEVIAQGIADEGLPLKIFNVAHTNASYILPHLYTHQAVMVGAPTYEGGLFPLMAQTLEMARHKHIFNKTAARFGSYAWNGGAQAEFDRLAEAMKWNLVSNYEFSGAPSQEELVKGRNFGKDFARHLKAN